MKLLRARIVLYAALPLLALALPVLLVSCMYRANMPDTPHIDVEVTLPFTPEPTPEVTPVVAPVMTIAPTPTATPEPTPEPTAYRSAAYPLPPKSLRTREGGRYPEEEKLNGDPDQFKAVVDLVNQAVMIYERDAQGEYSVLVREMICSSGIEATNRSPRGTFKMGEDKKRFAYFTSFYCYAQYWSQIRNRIYFHSVPYSERDDRFLMEEEFWKLGAPASHGCIRLMPDDAQWVYLYLCPGTTVVITDEFPQDAALRERLLPKATPAPDCYEIGA